MSSNESAAKNPLVEMFASSKVRAVRPATERRITFVVSGLYPTLGLERVTLSLLNALPSSYDVHVVCIGGSEADRSLFPGVLVLGSPLKGVRRVLSMVRLWRYSRRRDLGIVVTVGVWASIPWLLIAGHRKSPTIVWEHTLLREKYATSRQLRLLGAMARMLYQRAKCVVGVSRPVTDDVASYGNVRRMVTIPNITTTPSASDIHEALSARDPDPFRIVCVGSLTAIKSHHLAIKAMSLLDRKYSLTIIGSGPELENLTQLAVELGVRDRVEFTGHLEPALVRTAMQSASIMLHCSVAETFGLVYGEAANVGLPVVSVTTRVSREMIPRLVPGWLCENDPSSIAQSLQDAQVEVFGPEEFARAAAMRAELFGDSRVREQWVDLLESLGEAPGAKERDLDHGALL